MNSKHSGQAPSGNVWIWFAWLNFVLYASSFFIPPIGYSVSPDSRLMQAVSGLPLLGIALPALLLLGVHVWIYSQLDFSSLP